MNPQLSVIILQFNNHRYFESLYRSILNQATIPTEIIVADDCSSDGFDIDECYSFYQNNKNSFITNLRILVNEHNLGTVRNINNAIKHANGEFIKLIAVDDSFPTDDNNIFEEQCNFLINNSDCSFVFSDISICDCDLNPLNKKSIYSVIKDEKLLSTKSFKKIIKYNADLFAIQSICFRKSFFYSFDFDERLRLVEDLPLIVWAYSNKIKFGRIDKVGVLYRSDVGVSTTATSFSKKRIVYYQDLLNFYELILKPYKSIVGSLYFWTKKSVIDFRIKYTNKKSVMLIIRYFLPLLLYSFYYPNRARKYYKNRK